MSYVTESVTIRGTKIRLLKGGSGKPLIYLHGIYGSDEWPDFVSTLSENYTVYCPDHPGFGESDISDKIDHIQDLAYFYLDFIDQFDLEEVTLVGSSLGGWLALEIAVISPEKIKNLILIDATGIRVEGVEIPELFRMNPTDQLDLLYVSSEAKNAVAQKFEDPERETLNLKNKMGTAHLAWNPYFHNPKLLERIHRIQMPVLIVWGREDKGFPIPYAEKLNELIPHSELKVIDEAGHFPHLEKPIDVANIVQTFMSQGE